MKKNVKYEMSSVTLTEQDILKRLQKINIHKSAGADELCPRILKET